MDLYDEHTLYVRCGSATKNEIVAAIIESCKVYNAKHGARIECNVKVNLLPTYGFAFVYVTNPMVYNMLLGRNPDGTEQTFSESSEDDTPITDWSGFPKIGNWADFVEEEEARQREADKIKPLMTLPEKANNWEIYPAKAVRVGKDYIPNVLKSVRFPVPEWLTEADIKKQFVCFSSSKDTYPIVTFNKKREVLITFDPKTNDAYFALHMLKKMSIQTQTVNKIVRNVTLVFDHARNCDFDDSLPKYAPHSSIQKSQSNQYKNQNKSKQTNVRSYRN